MSFISEYLMIPACVWKIIIPVVVGTTFSAKSRKKERMSVISLCVTLLMIRSELRNALKANICSRKKMIHLEVIFVKLLRIPGIVD
jgi:hypothetical protein